jgi:ketosteroid isomerase-like protein
MIEEKTMTTQEVAKRLSQFFEENKWSEAQDELFAEEAVSIEPTNSPGLQTVKGLSAIKEKGKQFENMVEEVHGGYASEPIVAGSHIAVGMGMDVTMKGQGRMKMDEIAVYEVRDGKIVKEQFFY